MTSPQKEPLIAGRFRLRGQMGLGTMGWLYRAFDPERDSEVALRVVTAARSLFDVRDRLMEHIARLAVVSNASIAAVYECGISDGQLWFTSEYVRGVSLEKRVTAGGFLSPAEAVRIAIDVADAIERAHARELVHHDLKLRNIFLDGDKIVVADLGVAANIFTGAASIVVNTPGSASPEQLLRGRVDHRTDVYSLGACLWHAVVGEPPFKGGSSAQALAAQAGWRAPRPTDFRKTVPDGLELIILRAMAIDPEDRFQVMAELSQALSEWLLRGAG